MDKSQNYKYNCKLCKYNTMNKSEFARHENRKKHIKNTEANKLLQGRQKKKEDETWICNYCNKKYTHQSTVSRHTIHNCKLNDETKLYNYRKSSKKKEQQENIHISESEKDLKIKFLEEKIKDKEEKIKDKEEKIKDKEEIIKLLKEKYELAA